MPKTGITSWKQYVWTQEGIDSLERMGDAPPWSHRLREPMGNPTVGSKVAVERLNPDDIRFMVGDGHIRKIRGCYKERQAVAIARLKDPDGFDECNRYSLMENYILARLLVSWRNFNWKRLEDPHPSDDREFGTVVERIQKFDRFTQEELATKEVQARKNLQDGRKIGSSDEMVATRSLYCELFELLLAQDKVSEVKTMSKQLMVDSTSAWGSPSRDRMDIDMARTCLKVAALLIECDDYHQAAKLGYTVTYCRTMTKETPMGLEIFDAKNRREMWVGLREEGLALYNHCLGEDNSVRLPDPDGGCCAVL